MKKYVHTSSNSGLLGVFWYIDGKIVGTSEKLLDVDKSILIWNPSEDHFYAWDVIKKYLKLPDHVEYDYYPRGRVNYNSKIGRFQVIGYVGFLNNPALKAAIRAYYGLPLSTVFDTDDHYNYPGIFNQMEGS